MMMNKKRLIYSKQRFVSWFENGLLGLICCIGCEGKLSNHMLLQRPKSPDAARECVMFNTHFIF